MKEVQGDYTFLTLDWLCSLSFLPSGLCSVCHLQFVIPDVAWGRKAESQWFYVPAQMCGFCPLGCGELLKNFYSIIQLIVCN